MTAPTAQEAENELNEILLEYAREEETDDGIGGVWLGSRQEAEAAIASYTAKQVIEARIDEMVNLALSRSIEEGNMDTVWCDYCHMELIEGKEQKCACEIIAKKRLTELQAQRALLEDK